MTTTQGNHRTNEAESVSHDDVDELFDVLSNARRRYVISYLREADDDAVELTELVDQVTAQEPDHEGDHHEDVAISLHHVHLPKLAASGIVDYDARSKTVRYPSLSGGDEMGQLADEILDGRL